MDCGGRYLRAACAGGTVTRPDFSREQITCRSRSHPTSRAIARANRHLWRSRFRHLSDAVTCCWACQIQPEQLQQAHIQPVRFGGTDKPGNFLLLCGFCHLEQNDEVSPAEQLRWLREHKRWNEHWKDRLAANRAYLDSLPPVTDDEYWNAPRGKREAILEARKKEAADA